MASGDIKIQNTVYSEFTQNRIVGSGGAATINNGEPTKQGSSGAVAIMVDGDGTTSQVFTGIAKSVSTDTAAAAGTVQVWLPLPGIIYSAKAKSAAAADTQGEIDALANKRVVFDLTASAWTVDTAAGDSASANGILIVGGDYRTSVIYFIVRPAVAWNNLTT